VKGEGSESFLLLFFSNLSLNPSPKERDFFILFRSESFHLFILVKIEITSKIKEYLSFKI